MISAILRPGGAIAFLLTSMIGMVLLGGCKPPALRSDRETDGSSESLSGGEKSPPLEIVAGPAPGDPVAVSGPAPVVDEGVKQFPLARVITNPDGRSIPGEIVGKRGDEIAFKRTSDKMVFVVSLAQLSVNDQLDLAGLADESVEAVVALKGEQSTSAPASPAPVSPRQRSRRAEWHDDPEKAFAESKALGLPVYILFTGSDWCPPCKILEKTIHDDSDFREFADKNLILLVIDFPKRKSQSDKVKERNREMAEKWGVHGYPAIFLANEIDGATETVSRTRDVENFLSGVESAMARLSDGG